MRDMVFEFFIGKFIITLAFLCYAFATVFFFMSSREEIESRQQSFYNSGWLSLATKTFYVSSSLMLLSSARLMYLILSHQFQYNYVKHYSSTDLNIFYLVSTFYAGQEGSFLLWILYGSLIGIVIIRLAKREKSEVMTVIALSQTFLASMLLGIKVPGIGMIGSDPFALTMGNIPTEGDGLNALLQNPWMVIHPPTLFAGFSLTLVPFAYSVAAMWKHKELMHSKEISHSWVQSAMPWTLAATAVLGAGIMMGGYWAYGVLGWGGYWGWDPVENSSLSPWLILIALIHTMLVHKKNGGLKRLSYFLAVTAYCLVLYSAFLTRSGALADYSVHSFTDLGLYNQLLIFVVVFFLIGMGSLFAFTGSEWMSRFKGMKETTQSSTSTFLISKEFILLLGSLTILLVSVVVTIGTSAPIINRFFTDKPDPILPEFYNTTTLPLAVVIAFLSAIGQLIWWSNEKKDSIWKISLRPVTFSLATFLAILLFGLNDLKTGVLVLSAVFSFFASMEALLKITFSNLKMAGGTIAHLGLALMLIGFVSTGKYGQTKTLELPLNASILVFGKELTFLGVHAKGVGKTGFKIRISELNDSSSFSMVSPVLYETKRMSVQNPDILSEFTQDVYVSPKSYFLREHPNQLILSKDEGEQFFHGLKIEFLGFNYEKSTLEPQSPTDKLKVVAKIKVTTSSQEEIVEPSFVLHPQIQGNEQIQYDTIPISIVPNGNVSLINIDATNKKIMLSFSGDNVPTASQEVFVAEISTKPYINVLWLGTLLLIAGMGISVYRRQIEKA